MYMWFDASDTETIDTNASKELTAWRDKSGKKNDFTTITGNPTLSDYKINGFKTVYFDGSDVVGTTGTFQAPYTVIYAVQMEGSLSGRVITGDGNTLIGFHGGTKNDIYLEGWASNSATPITTDSELMSFSRTTASDSYFYNNGEEITLASAGNTDFGKLYLGARYNVGEPSKVYAMELLVYTRELTDVERKKIESYLNAKWGPF